MGLHTRVMTQTNFRGEKGGIGAHSSVLFIFVALLVNGDTSC